MRQGLTRFKAQPTCWCIIFALCHDHTIGFVHKGVTTINSTPLHTHNSHQRYIVVKFYIYTHLVGCYQYSPIHVGDTNQLEAVWYCRILAALRGHPLLVLLPASPMVPRGQPSPIQKPASWVVHTVVQHNLFCFPSGATWSTITNKKACFLVCVTGMTITDKEAGFCGTIEGSATIMAY